MMDFNNFYWLEKHNALPKITMHFTICRVHCTNVRAPQITKGKLVWVFTVTLSALGHFKGKMGELSDMALEYIMQDLCKFKVVWLSLCTRRNLVRSSHPIAICGEKSA